MTKTPVAAWRRELVRPCLRSCWMLIVGLALFGCSLPRGSRTHMLLLDYDGHAMDPSRKSSWFLVGKDYSVMKADEQSTYIAELISAIRAKVTDPQSSCRRVVLFINGGLNTKGGCVERANELTDRIVNDPMDPGYPVFIAWDSNLATSWFNHAFVVRRGRQDWIFGPLTAPLVICEDLVRGLLHLPADIAYYNFDTYIRGHYQYTPATTTSSQAVSAELARSATSGAAPLGPRGDRGDTVEFTTNPNSVRRNGILVAFWHYFAQLTIHIPQHVFIDGLGTSAWNEMDRRTDLLFDSEDSSLPATTVPPSRTALREFLGALAVLQSELQAPRQALQVDLVCHSMGAIVGNKILQLDAGPLRAGGEAKRVPSFANIVYMGAACSIMEYESSVFPYLAAHKDPIAPSHQDPHFYHLTLHERMEDRESTAGGLVPFGSLLTWVDNYYSHILTPPDRVVGRFTNLMNAYARTPEEIRDRIHIKSFGLTRDRQTSPHKHGDFSECDFWKRSFWRPDASLSWRPTP